MSTTKQMKNYVSNIRNNHLQIKKKKDTRLKPENSRKTDLKILQIPLKCI